MLRGTALASVAILPLLGACVVPDDGLDRGYATPSVAFQGRSPMDHDRGIWGAQSVTPPAGLVLVRQGSLVGRNIEDNAGNPLAWIEYLLVDPATNDAHYAVVSSNRFANYVAVPLSAMRLTPTAVTFDGNERNLLLAPKYTVAELDRRYSRTTAYPAATGLPPVLPMASLPSMQPQPFSEPLQLMRRGSVVGMSVIDSVGQPVGHVDAVATNPATGEVRYAVISGPTLGIGQYIVVPAGSTSTANGRVMLVGAPGSWAQAPRYRGDQVQSTFGSLGVIN
jgi:sporulation protein YlmC with PRC-barrel domain